MEQAAAQKIYMIEDEPEICWMVKKVLSEKGFEVHTAFNGEQGLEMAASIQPDLILLDLQLSGMDGLEILRRIKEQFNRLPVIILSAVDAVDVAVRAMKMGAYDYLSKPLNVEALCVTLENALKTSRLMSEVDNLKRQVTDQQKSPIIWTCPPMQKVMETVDHIANYDVTVMLRGESGTGKELLAQYIHCHSGRAGRPMISVDCSALPENLVESELFGYERGAFTGAHKDKPGRFELAQGGTLFLDEISNLPLNTQVKLLRVLQERRLQRLGGKREIGIDVRLITAVNANLESAMRAGMFREDLFHRLNEFAIYVPPLRERGEEIDLLAGCFLERFNRQFNRSIKDFSPEAIWLMRRYSWPGNVRELINVIKRAAVLTAGDTIESTHFPPEILEQTDKKEEPITATSEPCRIIRPLSEICQEATRKIEHETITRALEQTRWNKVKAARLLKINYKTLFNKIKELGI